MSEGICDPSDPSTLFESFGLQISEIEMLSSMYPDESEFQLTLPHVLSDMESFISGNNEVVPYELDFTMNIEVQDVKSKLELSINLPHNYPTSRPLVTARAPILNRTQQSELNTAIREYLEDIPPGELCIIPLVNWLSETAKQFFNLQSSLVHMTRQQEPAEVSNKGPWCRSWIYSHHIYSKFKRKEILDIAQFLDLSGFSLPGKPGFICVEGTKADCSEFLQQLKNMNWKKISLVKEEVVDSEDVSSDFRRFIGFEEISFQVRRGPAKEYHMDMGEFLKYLEKHDCAYAFQDLFGLEGHVSCDKAQ